MAGDLWRSVMQRSQKSQNVLHVIEDWLETKVIDQIKSRPVAGCGIYIRELQIRRPTQ